MDKSRTWAERDMNLFYQQNGTINYTDKIPRDELLLWWDDAKQCVAAQSVTGATQNCIGQYDSPIGSKTYPLTAVTSDPKGTLLGTQSFPTSQCNGVKVYILNTTSNRAYRLVMIFDVPNKKISYTIDALA